MDPNEPSRDVPGAPTNRQAAELGLASLVIGACVFLAAPVLAILAAQIWAHADRTPSVVLLHAWLARIAVCVPMIMVFVGGWLGVLGLRRASREGSSAGLPLAGLFLNVSAMCGWALASIGLLNTTESMLRLLR